MKKYYVTLLLLWTAITGIFAQAGRVGINTTNPKATLHVQDSSILFSGPVALPEEAGPVPVSDAGHRTMWYADKAAFRTGGVDGAQWNKDSIGYFSFAGGANNIAKGYCSVAIGNNTMATGQVSTVMGYGCRAIGDGTLAIGGESMAIGHYSTAMGINTKAIGVATTSFGILNESKGNASTTVGHGNIAGGYSALASGFHLIANGYSSTVIGLYNDSIVGPQSELSSESPLFVIGNGAENQRKNAVVVRYDGRVGMGTNAPAAKLHVAQGSVLFSGQYAINSTSTVPVSGSGKRMMWHDGKAAFRAGRVWTSEWNEENIGIYSFAGGDNCIAKGVGSVAFGEDNQAQGDHAFTAGNSNMANGGNSMALGFDTQSQDFASFSAGWKTEALKDEAMALNTKTIADAYSATSMGLGTRANATASLAIGSYNEPLVDPMEGYVFGSTHPVFIVGNGSPGLLSNAMVLFRNGHMGLGTNTPGARFHAHEPTPNKEVARFSAAGTGYAEVDVSNDNNSLKLGVAGSNAYLGTGMAGNIYVKTNAIDRMTILNDGNVGIGTTSPFNRLHVISPAQNSVVSSFNSGGGYGAISVGNGAQTFQLGVNADHGYVNANPGKDFIIFTGGESQLMVDGSSNRVGIGTVAPARKLHVYEAASNSIISRFENTGGFGEINVSNGSATLDFGVWNDEGYLGTKSSGNLFIRTNAVNRMMIDISGNVGIGTTAPGATLEVNGSAAKPGGGTWVASSDVRLKQNIMPYTDGLEKILGIKPVSYQYKALSGFDTTQTHVGVIAQELETVAPDMVRISEKVAADGTSGYLTVDNSAMVYMLINAVKEQQQLIKELQEQVAELQKN